jgi:Protein of unknown function (DUF4011)/AAA domain
VLEDGGGRPGAGQEALIRSAFRGWRDSLIDLSAANRLLNLKPSRSGVIEVMRPAADDILTRLRTGGTFTFRSLKPWLAGPDPDPAAAAGGERAPGAGALPPPAPYILDTSKDPYDLDAALRALMRRSDQVYLDRGLPSLYLTFGTVTWPSRDGSRYPSPLLLVPARLAVTEPALPPMLEPADDDAIINPALSLLLAQCGIALPPAQDMTLAGLLGAAHASVSALDGWQVSESAALACFSFSKEAIYQDLREHEDQIAAHPAVRALAAPGPGTAVPAAGYRSGRHAAAGGPPPARVPPVVLDADSSQRACIAAALGGHSFIVNGPPGTGKSQTIANMIGALLHDGRTVLFMSDKAAALDVVRDRLSGAGLGGYLLELHSQQAARHEVAASLARALSTAPAGPAVPADAQAAQRLREQLTAYADSLHRVRDPLGYSLHDVLTMIASLQAVPAAPSTGPAPVDLTADALAEVRHLAEALAGAWRPAEQGRSFPWRGVTERGSLDDRLYQAASALEALSRVVRVNQTLADATGLTRPSDAQALAGLLDHLLAWPEGLPDGWLTVDTLDAVDAAVAQLAAALGTIAAGESQAARAAGIPWSSIPAPATLPAADLAPLAALSPACADVSGLAADQITGVVQAFSASAETLETQLGNLSGLAGMLGLRPPVTFTDASDLLTLTQLAGEPDRAERPWLSVPGYQAASAAGQALYDAHRALADAEAAASPYFTADALRHDVAGLAQRFMNEYRRLGRLSGDYRADRKTVAAFTQPGVTPEVAQEQLGLAAAWQQAAEAVTAAELAHAPALTPHYTGRSTDFARLGRALNHAATALRCARGQDLSQAAGYLCRDAAPNRVAVSIGAEIRHELSAWQAGLAAAPAIAPRPELLDAAITDAIRWLRAHLAPLRAASEFTRAVGEALGRSLSFGQAQQVIKLREAAGAAHAQLAARDEDFREVCGQLYAGPATDVMALRDALEWARHLRTVMGNGPGPLTPAQLSAAESAVPSDRVAKASDAWRDACGALLAAFSPQRRQELTVELDDFAGGDELLEAMFKDTSGRDEWHAYQAARAALASHRLDGAVDFCATERVTRAQIPLVIERALLQDWAEHQLRTDPALAPLRAAGRDGLVSEYQRLDRAVAALAADDIIRACNARRPSGDSREAALIQHEAGKQGQQLPVRDLIGQAPRVIQAIKPCFLLPPVAVSRCLPPGLRFDVVIVDEASQLSPADVLPGVYRGSALVLAGDSKQLPPATRAVSAVLDEGEEPPAQAGPAAGPVSILDLAVESGAFPQFPLRWHYRSRHEALFAFANSAFYAGRVLPVARGGEPGAGVELLYGNGTCRQAGAGDNPQEAARVVQRIIHHISTRPGLSLGVVAFTQAQAATIEAALVKARKQRPELDRFFTAGRLRGFFIKDAESVQGDERDVLIVSVGYGPDEQGQFTADSGPLSGQGGWRRLNVATTRARYRTEIVASIRPGDIPGSATGDGARQLRRYLSYAARNSPGRSAR